jgi:hypothetical protein
VNAVVVGFEKYGNSHNIVISSINRTFATTPPLTGHPSIEGNYLGASRGKGKNRRPGFIPLHGGVACHAGVVSCLIYYRNGYNGWNLHDAHVCFPSKRMHET